MKTIVITGATRGIGYGLAVEFLKRGCQVVISGRSQTSVAAALDQLHALFPAEQIHGVACDIQIYEQVQGLWTAATERFGRVDVWINNAGLINPSAPLWQQTTEQIDNVVATNLTGLLYACKVAINGMIDQGSGQIYNMEGYGSDGRVGNGLTLYGSTKYAVTYLTKSLIQETRETPVQVCYLSPGIVHTDMLADQYTGRPEDFERAKRFYNILGDRVETVTPYLAQKILDNNRAGVKIAWLTTPKAFWRFLTAPVMRRNIFD